MTKFSRYLLLPLCLVASASLAADRPMHVQAELVSSVTSFVPGQPFDVALREKIEPGWHTYWKNPGDAGAPSRIKWLLPEGFSAGDIQWPWPMRITYGPLMDYGYEKEVLLPVTITPPADFSGTEVVIKAHARWLVCADVCVPEQADLSLTLPAAANASPDPATQSLFDAARQRIPRALGVEASWQLTGKQVSLQIPMTDLSGARIKSVDFFPEEAGSILNAAPQHFRVDDQGLTLTLAADKGVTRKSSMAGVVVVTETRGQTQTSGFRVNPGYQSSEPAAGSMDPWTAILFALLGGLILNLMPCVFPVLSIKVLALAAHRDGDHVRANGWVYALGVVLGFVAIAAVLLVLRTAGEQIGWGFQLQSPVVVAGLAYLFFVIGLNFSGYFEAGTSLMSLGDGLASRPGITGSFFTGLLATVVAAPCTAPFMAGAVGYALLVNNLLALAIFAALGLGMAAPYVLLCYFPALLRLLPRPGAWMQTFRELLAFPMYGSAIWLVWVLSQQTGMTGVVVVLSGGLLLTAAIWVGRRKWLRPAMLTLAALLVLVALYLPFRLVAAMPVASVGKSEVKGEQPKDTLWQPYSAERLAELRKQGPVFVDFSAAWCITCKVNEAVALDNAKVRAAFASHHVQALRGDWTNQDPEITRALSEYGRSGVPLYLLYKPGEARARVLPQILTESAVLQAVQSL